MLLTHADETDFGEIAELANNAYRGGGATRSWNTEVGILKGPRLNESLLREELAGKRDGQLMTLRDSLDGPLLGMVLLAPEEKGTWYLGLFAVRPELQQRRLGSYLLSVAEEFARERGAWRIRMTVLHVRAALIAWYQRRGYAANGQTVPFPYGDERFGRPLRDDLHFIVMEKKLEKPQFQD